MGVWHKLGIAIGSLAAVVCVACLGIYLAASSASSVDAQPRNASEAREVVRALGIESEYPFEHRFFESPHGRLHYLDEGTGAPVFCVHGNPTWSFLYRELVRGLSDEARVVAPDLIGFGLSEKPPDPAAYTIAGLLAALAGILLAGRIGAVDLQLATNFLLPSVAAAQEAATPAATDITEALARAWVRVRAEEAVRRLACCG